MKKKYIKPEGQEVVLNTRYTLLTLSGDSLGNEKQIGDDYARGDDYDWEDE